MYKGRPKFTKESYAQWCDDFISIYEPIIEPITSYHEFNVFMMRFATFLHRKKFGVPPRIHSVISTAIHELCELPDPVGESDTAIAQLNIFHAFAFGCALKDIELANICWNKLIDDEKTRSQYLPNTFMNWFNRANRKLRK